VAYGSSPKSSILLVDYRCDCVKLANEEDQEERAEDDKKEQRPDAPPSSAATPIWAASAAPTPTPTSTHPPHPDTAPASPSASASARLRDAPWLAVFGGQVSPIALCLSRLCYTLCWQRPLPLASLATYPSRGVTYPK
jgi:hypothetical protein